ncbi:uncharacterized protein son.S isoform X2 [Xenopus laevis]|uniref:Uncharacterized protein son.S isoform X2 n=1 Tax=Xenopus laevis TaxID=8355 RepID=A0A8J1MCA9_XENLA|nr:uncharacterized protein son.S isoform X2 [Xenopus laevis]
MATNIEQIFRSFVVNKFKEIQEEKLNSENSETSQNGELTAQMSGNPSEETITDVQDKEQMQSESTQLEQTKSLDLEAESASKELKSGDVSSSDEVKKDASRKKSKKHKKHKSKKKKKKKKKEKSEKRSKSVSSAEDQDNVSEHKAVWKPAFETLPKEDGRVDVSKAVTTVEENHEIGVKSCGFVQEGNLDSDKINQAVEKETYIDSEFFGPKCPKEIKGDLYKTCSPLEEGASKELFETPTTHKSSDNSKTLKQDEATDMLDNSVNAHSTAKHIFPSSNSENELLLEHESIAVSQTQSVDLINTKMDSIASAPTASLPYDNTVLHNSDRSKLKCQSRSRSTSISKLRSKETCSSSKSVTKKDKSRSKPLGKGCSSGIGRQSRSSSLGRRQKSHSSSVGKRKCSHSNSPVHRRESRSSTPAHQSKSPIRKWWSKSITRRERTVSVSPVRRRRSRTRSNARRRRSRTRSAARKPRSRTRSVARRHRSKTRSVARRRKSGSRSTSNRRKSRSRSASRRRRQRSQSASRRRKSKSLSVSRRRRSKSRSVARRGKSQSRSLTRRRRSRSGSASRRRRSRSGSASRRQRSRSGSASRRRRSRSDSAGRRHRSRSGSIGRGRRSRSSSAGGMRRRSRSDSARRRRRSRSGSARRRCQSRSGSAGRRRRSRSGSAGRRRRRSRSGSAGRRRRSRSGSAGRRRRSRSGSARRRGRSRSVSGRRRRRSRSGSACRRQRTGSRSAPRRRKSRSCSATSRSGSKRSVSRSVAKRNRSSSVSLSRRPRTRSGSVTKKQRSRSSSDSKRERSGSAAKRKQSRSVAKRMESSTADGRRISRSRSSSQKQRSQSASGSRRSRSTTDSRKQKSRSRSAEKKFFEDSPDHKVDHLELKIKSSGSDYKSKESTSQEQTTSMNCPKNITDEQRVLGQSASLTDCSDKDPLSWTEISTEPLKRSKDTDHQIIDSDLVDDSATGRPDPPNESICDANDESNQMEVAMELDSCHSDSDKFSTTEEECVLSDVFKKVPDDLNSTSGIVTQCFLEQEPNTSMLTKGTVFNSYLNVDESSFNLCPKSEDKPFDLEMTNKQQRVTAFTVAGELTQSHNILNALPHLQKPESQTYSETEINDSGATASYKYIFPLDYKAENVELSDHAPEMAQEKGRSYSSSCNLPILHNMPDSAVSNRHENLNSDLFKDQPFICSLQLVSDTNDCLLVDKKSPVVRSEPEHSDGGGAIQSGSETLLTDSSHPDNSPQTRLNMNALSKEKIYNQKEESFYDLEFSNCNADVMQNSPKSFQTDVSPEQHFQEKTLSYVGDICTSGVDPNFELETETSSKETSKLSKDKKLTVDNEDIQSVKDDLSLQHTPNILSIAENQKQPLASSKNTSCPIDKVATFEKTLCKGSLFSYPLAEDFSTVNSVQKAFQLHGSIHIKPDEFKAQTEQVLHGIPGDFEKLSKNSHDPEIIKNNAADGTDIQGTAQVGQFKEICTDFERTVLSELPSTGSNEQPLQINSELKGKEDSVQNIECRNEIKTPIWQVDIVYPKINPPPTHLPSVDTELVIPKGKPICPGQTSCVYFPDIPDSRIICTPPDNKTKFEYIADHGIDSVMQQSANVCKSTVQFGRALKDSVLNSIHTTTQETSDTEIRKPEKDIVVNPLVPDIVDVQQFSQKPDDRFCIIAKGQNNLSKSIVYEHSSAESGIDEQKCLQEGTREHLYISSQEEPSIFVPAEEESAMSNDKFADCSQLKTCREDNFIEPPAEQIPLGMSDSIFKNQELDDGCKIITANIVKQDFSNVESVKEHLSDKCFEDKSNSAGTHNVKESCSNTISLDNSTFTSDFKSPVCAVTDITRGSVHHSLESGLPDVCSSSWQSNSKQKCSNDQKILKSTVTRDNRLGASSNHLELDSSKTNQPNESEGPASNYEAIYSQSTVCDNKVSPQGLSNAQTPTGQETQSGEIVAQKYILSVPLNFKFSRTFKPLSISALHDNAHTINSPVTQHSKQSLVTGSETLLSSKSATLDQSKTTIPTPESNALSVPEPEGACDLSLLHTPESSGQSVSQPSEPVSCTEVEYFQIDAKAEPSFSSTTAKPAFPQLSNPLAKGVKQRQYRSRSMAQDSRSPSVDRDQSPSKSASRKRSHSKSRKRRSRSKSLKGKHSSYSQGRKRRSRSKSKTKKRQSPSKQSSKRRRSRSKSVKRQSRSPSRDKRRPRSKSTGHRKQLSSKSPTRKKRSHSRSDTRRRHSRKSSRSKSPVWKNRSNSKSVSKSPSKSASQRRHSKSRLPKCYSRSSSRSASPGKHSGRRNRSSSKSPTKRRCSRSRSRGRWGNSRSSRRGRSSRSPSRRNRSRSGSQQSRSLSDKNHQGSRSPIHKKHSRSQTKLDKSPLSKHPSKSKSPPPPPPKKNTQSKSTAFKHSIGLKSLIQKQLSQAKLQSSNSKLSSKEQLTVASLTTTTQLPASSLPAKTPVPVANLPSKTRLPETNMNAKALPPLSNQPQKNQLPLLNKDAPLSVLNTNARAQQHVTDLATETQWPVADISTGAQWAIPDMATGGHWALSDMTAAGHWTMPDMTAAGQWAMPDLSSGSQWPVTDMTSGPHWTMSDMSTGTQWPVSDLSSGTQWPVSNLSSATHWPVSDLATGAQWHMPDLGVGTQWHMPDLTAGVSMPELTASTSIPDLTPSFQMPDLPPGTSVIDLAPPPAPIPAVAPPPAPLPDVAPHPTPLPDLAPPPVPLPDLAPPPAPLPDLTPPSAPLPDLAPPPALLTDLAPPPAPLPDLAPSPPAPLPDLAPPPPPMPDLAPPPPPKPNLAPLPAPMPDLALAAPPFPMHHLTSLSPVPDLALSPAPVPHLVTAAQMHDLAPVPTPSLTRDLSLSSAQIPDLAPEVTPEPLPDLAPSVPVSELSSSSPPVFQPLHESVDNQNAYLSEDSAKEDQTKTLYVISKSPVDRNPFLSADELVKPGLCIAAKFPAINEKFLRGEHSEDHEVMPVGAEASAGCDLLKESYDNSLHPLLDIALVLPTKTQLSVPSACPVSMKMLTSNNDHPLVQLSDQPSLLLIQESFDEPCHPQRKEQCPASISGCLQGGSSDRFEQSLKSNHEDRSRDIRLDEYGILTSSPLHNDLASHSGTLLNEPCVSLPLSQVIESCESSSRYLSEEACFSTKCSPTTASYAITNVKSHSNSLPDDSCLVPNEPLQDDNIVFLEQPLQHQSCLSLLPPEQDKTSLCVKESFDNCPCLSADQTLQEKPLGCLDQSLPDESSSVFSFQSSVDRPCLSPDRLLEISVRPHFLQQTESNTNPDQFQLLETGRIFQQPVFAETMYHEPSLPHKLVENSNLLEDDKLYESPVTYSSDKASASPSLFSDDAKEKLTFADPPGGHVQQTSEEQCQRTTLPDEMFIKNDDPLSNKYFVCPSIPSVGCGSINTEYIAQDLKNPDQLLQNKSCHSPKKPLIELASSGQLVQKSYINTDQFTTVEQYGYPDKQQLNKEIVNTNPVMVKSILGLKDPEPCESIKDALSPKLHAISSETCITSTHPLEPCKSPNQIHTHEPCIVIDHSFVSSEQPVLPELSSVMTLLPKPSANSKELLPLKSCMDSGHTLLSKHSVSPDKTIFFQLASSPYQTTETLVSSNKDTSPSQLASPGQDLPYDAWKNPEQCSTTEPCLPAADWESSDPAFCSKTWPCAKYSQPNKPSVHGEPCDSISQVPPLGSPVQSLLDQACASPLLPITDKLSATPEQPLSDKSNSSLCYLSDNPCTRLHQSLAPEFSEYEPSREPVQPHGKSDEVILPCSIVIHSEQNPLINHEHTSSEVACTQLVSVELCPSIPNSDQYLIPDASPVKPIQSDPCSRPNITPEDSLSATHRPCVGSPSMLQDECCESYDHLSVIEQNTNSQYTLVDKNYGSPLTPESVQILQTPLMANELSLSPCQIEQDDQSVTDYSNERPLLVKKIQSIEPEASASQEPSTPVLTVSKKSTLCIGANILLQRQTISVDPISSLPHDTTFSVVEKSITDKTDSFITSEKKDDAKHFAAEALILHSKAIPSVEHDTDREEPVTVLDKAEESSRVEKQFRITPPDLLPYDSDQPALPNDTSDAVLEQIAYNCQPPPELLPYDSEQPANAYLGLSETQSEHASPVFHTPPELLPYDSEQPAVLHTNNELPSINLPASLSQAESTSQTSSVPDSLHLDECMPGNFQSEEEQQRTQEPQTTKVLFEYGSIADVSEFPMDNTHEQLECESAASYQSEVSNTPAYMTLHSAECNLSTQISSENTKSINTSSEKQFSSALPIILPESTNEGQIDFNQMQSNYMEPVESSRSVGEDACITELPTELSVAGKPHVAEFTSEQLSVAPEALVHHISLSEFATKAEHSASISASLTGQRPLLTELSLYTESQVSEVSVAGESITTSEQSNIPALESPVLPQEASFKRSRSKSINDRTNSRSRSKSVTSMKRSKSRTQKRSRSKSATSWKRSRSKSVAKRQRSHSKSAVESRRSRSKSTKRSRSKSHMQRKRSRSKSTSRRKRSRSKPDACKRRSCSRSAGRKRRSRSRSVGRKRRSRSKSPVRKRRSRSKSTGRKRRSRSKSTGRKKRSRSKSYGRKRRSRSTSASQRRRSRSTTLARHRRSSSVSVARRRRSRSTSATRRRRSRSTSVVRRKRSHSSSVARRRRSRSVSAGPRRTSRSVSVPRRRRSQSVSRRRRSRSQSVTRRRRSQSGSRRRRSRSASMCRIQRSPSTSITRKGRSRSVSVANRRRSRSASEACIKPSRSVSATRKKRSVSKSLTPKSPTYKPSAVSRSERSRSHSQSNVLRKRKTRSRSSSRDKNKLSEKRRRRSNSKDHYNLKSRRRSRTPPRRKKSRSPVKRMSPVRRRRSRSNIRRKSFSRSPVRRKRSRSRDKSMESSRSPKRLTDLDKAQLLEIAKANAAAMCAKAGVPLPSSLKPVITPVTPVEEKITLRSYGVTIQELTEKCKQIAQSKEDDVIVNKPHDSDEEEEERPFYNHPFKVSDHKPISFSLLNPSVKPAPKNQVTLTKEFPVSSGSQHRKKEADKVYGEWVPVDKKTEESKDDVFTNTGPTQPVDITSAMNERALAQTRLTGNPFDMEALILLNRAQEQIDAWAQSTSLPGQFTGSTGAQVLSADEISNSGPQAWLKKDQFLKAAPVSGGRGALLMRKMGWKEGKGLGRHNEGNVDPILIDFKTDRKGLVADGEKASNKLALPMMKDLSGKHPISALMELCNKKKWSPPEFVLVDDTGPEHRKRFLFRVTVSGGVYQPNQPSLNKKLAKATAAAAALQALGALPKESMTSTANFRSASTSTS